MIRQDGLRLLEATLDLAPHSLTGTEALRDLDGWDSLATMGYLASVDRELGLPLPGSRVARCQTVAELLDVLDEAATRRAA